MIPKVLIRLSLSVISTKASQYLAIIRRMPGAMYVTGFDFPDKQSTYLFLHLPELSLIAE